ncbi:hypothetical protein ES703_45030 [subsurface metagenome]
MDLEIAVQTDVDCHLTMRYQQHGIEPHERMRMIRGVAFYTDPHLAFDNYRELDELHSGDHKTHRFKLPFPYICKTYYWKFVGTVGGVWSPSHSPVFLEHLTEVIEVTKEIYFPVAYTNGRWSTGRLHDAELTTSAQIARMPFSIPDNFETLLSAEIICHVVGRYSACNWDINSAYGKEGEYGAEHLEEDVTTTYNTLGIYLRVFLVDASGILTGISAGDVGGVLLQLMHSEHDVNVCGLRLKYE